MRSVQSAPVAHLATHGPEGRIDLVPVTFALIGSGADARFVTAVDHKPKSTRHLRRLDNIRTHPTVTVLVDHYDDDWDKLWWVRLNGEARVVDAETSEGSAMVDALVAKYPQYRAVRPAGPVIEVTPTRWHEWSADPQET